MKIIVASILLLIVLGIGLYLRNWSNESFMPSKVKRIAIKLQNGQNTIYGRAKAWGLTGDHEEIVFSLEDINTSDTSRDYIFYTSSVFYRIDNDSILTIYAPESSISEPSRVVTKMPINIQPFASEDELTADTLKFRKLGLKTLSIYP